MSLIVRDSIFINGEWVPSSGTGVLEVTNSTTEEVMGTIPDGTAADVDAAVAAAKAAFPGWAATAPEERGKYCVRIADALAARMDEVATLISQEVGMVKALSKIVQAGLPYNSFSTIPQVIAEFPWEEKIGELPDRARAGRRCRRHHPLELPASPDRRQGGVRPGGGVHRGAQTLGDRPPQRLRSR